ncbi:MAG: hypothetical protein A2X48_17515 [Lentisphaerae bacterium GWF2_49_21]|nr:MAG: hypothetical protein A2X48_17515 [Lentisphaerae bacterium GWF2_49_21]
MLLLSSVPNADAASPFTWTSDSKDGKITIKADIQKDCYLYSDKTKIQIADSADKTAKLLRSPETVNEKDAFNKEHSVYPEGVNIWEYSSDGLAGALKASIEFQGCSRKPFLCYPPKKIELTIQTIPEETKSPAPKPEPEKIIAAPATWKELAARSKLAGSEVGYMNASEFISFLESSVNPGKTIKYSLFDNLKDSNLIISFLLIMLGGLALNLTPCVLPLIPVNLAIIGAGANATSKFQGFVLGLMYGIGITLAYGLLGIAAVLTGSTFGAINASPFFNFAAALVFIFLALAMFDIFPIDFSKFLKSGTDNKSRSMITAMTMGAVSALLAGACVAPVVIAVLLFSSYLYSQGDFYGLLLPFLLGAGMALPWPFAGAGLALLPKPGAWMVKVKYVFGVFIIAIATYYAYSGYSIISKKGPAPIESGWLSSLPEAFANSEKEKLPLLIDFTASWCKNCEAMDLTTLRNAKVTGKLEGFVKVKYHAENPDDPETFEVLTYFKVLGFPTYLVLLPQN